MKLAVQFLDPGETLLTLRLEFAHLLEQLGFSILAHIDVSGLTVEPGLSVRGDLFEAPNFPRHDARPVLHESASKVRFAFFQCEDFLQCQLRPLFSYRGRTLSAASTRFSACSRLSVVCLLIRLLV